MDVKKPKIKKFNFFAIWGKKFVFNFFLYRTPFDSKLNSVQDGINRLSLACPQVAVTPLQKVITHPVQVAYLSTCSFFEWDICVPNGTFWPRD